MPFKDLFFVYTYVKKALFLIVLISGLLQPMSLIPVKIYLFAQYSLFLDVCLMPLQYLRSLGTVRLSILQEAKWLLWNGMHQHGRVVVYLSKTGNIFLRGFSLLFSLQVNIACVARFVAIINRKLYNQYSFLHSWGASFQFSRWFDLHYYIVLELD